MLGDGRTGAGTGHRRAPRVRALSSRPWRGSSTSAYARERKPPRCPYITRMKKWYPVVVALAAWLIAGSWLISVSLLVLVAGWMLLSAEEGPPVLALAFTMQWIAVSVGLFYIAITGRPL